MKPERPGMPPAAVMAVTYAMILVLVLSAAVISVRAERKHHDDMNAAYAALWGGR